MYQDTPQGQLDFTELENQKWATNYTMNNGFMNLNKEYALNKFQFIFSWRHESLPHGYDRMFRTAI